MEIPDRNVHTPLRASLSNRVSLYIMHSLLAFTGGCPAFACMQKYYNNVKNNQNLLLMITKEMQ